MKFAELPTNAKQAALGYARQYGWSVVPIIPGRKRPPIRWSRLSRAAATDPDFIEAMWDKFPEAHVGILTGARSGGLVVVDIDSQKGGVRPDDLPETLTASTPSGGIHLFFMAEGTTRNSVEIRPGVDFRGDGGLVVAVPAPGREWTVRMTPAPLPDDWLGKARRRVRLPIRSQMGDSPIADAAIMSNVDAVIDGITDACEGGRNDMLNRMSYSLAMELLVWNRDPEDWLWDRLIEAGLEVGLEQRETEMTVRSAIDAARHDYQGAV